MNNEIMGTLKQEFSKYDAKFDDFKKNIELLEVELAAIKAGSSSRPPAPGSSSPVEPRKPKAKKYKMDDSWIYRRSTSVPPPRGEEEMDSDGIPGKYGIFIGGWERPIATHFRRKYYDEQVAIHFTHNLKEKAFFKGPAMKNMFHHLLPPQARQGLRPRQPEGPDLCL